MTYNTPELLLVGAAHNLVLGHIVDAKVPHITNTDSVGSEEYTNEFGVDNTSW